MAIIPVQTEHVATTDEGFCVASALGKAGKEAQVGRVRRLRRRHVSVDGGGKPSGQHTRRRRLRQQRQRRRRLRGGEGSARAEGATGLAGKAAKQAGRPVEEPGNSDGADNGYPLPPPTTMSRAAAAAGESFKVKSHVLCAACAPDGGGAPGQCARASASSCPESAVRVRRCASPRAPSRSLAPSLHRLALLSPHSLARFLFSLRRALEAGAGGRARAAAGRSFELRAR